MAQPPAKLSTMSRIVSKAELARWGGVSRQAVAKLCKPGALLYDATTAKGVDVEHPLVVEWLSGHGVDEIPENGAQAKPKADRPPTPTPKKPPAADPPPTVPAAPDGVEDLENMTVREVVMRYGSVDGFKRFVESLKNIAEYKHRELRVRQQRGELIERDKVAGVVFPLVEVAFTRLVSDVPEAVSKQVIARVESGGPDTTADVVALIRDANSRVLKNLKQSVTRLEFLDDAN